jgi:hypothetical protein
MYLILALCYVLTFASGSAAKARLSRLETVDFPTPPFPESTKYFRFILDNRPAISEMAMKENRWTVIRITSRSARYSSVSANYHKPGLPATKYLVPNTN